MAGLSNPNAGDGGTFAFAAFPSGIPWRSPAKLTWRNVLLVLVVLASGSFAFSKKTPTAPSPEQFFGFKIGEDRKLADWVQLTEYYRKLAQESDRIKFVELGKTTEGRPFVLATISEPENLAQLETYRQIQERLADPRKTTQDQAKSLIERGKTILAITCNIHSTEIASSQTAAQFAWELVTGDSPRIREILSNTIILLVPSLNPDGQQLVVDWYKKYLGTPYEGAQPVVLWHHYVGHDDNRDWYTFTQAETRLTVSKILNVWNPQIVYDVHQMGAGTARIYVPPWVDPVDPNIDPILLQGSNALGTMVAQELTAEGKKGVLVNGVYDLWSPARHYMFYHGGIRILTESASANIASPITVPFDALERGRGYDAKQSSWNFPEPWPGGVWRVGDIVQYQLAAFYAIAEDAAHNRQRYLRNFYEVGRRAIANQNGPYAFVVPASQKDPAATARLINLLRFGSVEIQQAQAEFEADGTRYAAGSYFIRMDQPYKSFAKTLLEKQEYPDLREYPGGPPRRPYDVTTQSLPLLFGVQVIPVKRPFTVSAVNVVTVQAPSGSLKADAQTGYVFEAQANSDLLALFTLLKQGVSAYRLTGSDYPPGTIYLPQQEGLPRKLEDVAAHFAVSIRGIKETPAGNALAVKLPRIGLYQSWVPSMDEGWTRWIFDQDAIPYVSVYDSDLRKGSLGERFDVLVLPDNSAKAILTGDRGFGGEASSAIPSPPTPPEYTGGLGDEGWKNLVSFAEGGGTVIALNRASVAFTDSLPGAPGNVLKGVANKDFYGPGSLLLVTVDPTHPIGFGAEPTLPIFFEQSPAFQTGGHIRSIASYETDKPLLSGWLLGGERLKGKSALAEISLGKGRVILFGFRPQYRAQSEATYKLFFNALLYAASTPQVLDKRSVGAPVGAFPASHSPPGYESRSSEPPKQ